MKISKVLIAVVVLAIAAYFVVNNMSSRSVPVKAKPGWFTKLDVNNDGKISQEELKVIDANGDGKISREESRAHGIPDSEFLELDVNGDGHITQDEMKTYGG